MNKAINNHKGHDVICKQCNLQATEFIDYVKTIKDGRLYLYDKNKCWCVLPSYFYCKDCKTDIELDKE